MPTDRSTSPANDVEEDAPALSSQALGALREFLSEQQRREPAGEVALVSEDWSLSQFWYDRDTAEAVAEEICRLCTTAGSAAACIACPTLYPYVKKLNKNVQVQLLEYDMRFQQYGSDFTYYDYDQPEELPPELKHAFRVVVADPPYLSKECLEKISQTMAFLAHPQRSYLLLLTGTP